MHKQIDVLYFASLAEQAGDEERLSFDGDSLVALYQQLTERYNFRLLNTNCRGDKPWNYRLGYPHSTGRYCRFYSACGRGRFTWDKPTPTPPR